MLRTYHKLEITFQNSLLLFLTKMLLSKYIETVLYRTWIYIFSMDISYEYKNLPRPYISYIFIWMCQK